ncbi:hypothetical protein BCR36DRAFT_273289, partial [Piromyces finnis]
NIENNNKLYGRIPSNNYDDCNFSGTHICYSKDNYNSNCTYPARYYDCTKCVKNASRKDDICQCSSELYYGIGYIECREKSSNGIEKFCLSVCLLFHLKCLIK